MSVNVSGGTHDIIYSMITLQVSRRHNHFSHFIICRQNIEAVLLKKSKSFKTSVYKPIKSKEKCRPKLLIMLVSRRTPINMCCRGLVGNKLPQQYHHVCMYQQTQIKTRVITCRLEMENTLLLTLLNQIFFKKKDTMDS